MKYSKLTTLIFTTLFFISACSTNTRTVTNSNLDEDSTESLSYDDLYSDADPTEDLFDDEEAIEEAPEEEITNITAADQTATACMSSDDAWAPGASASQNQWLCLNNNASSGAVGEDTIMSLAAASIGMFNNCGIAVRQELSHRMAGMSGSVSQQNVAELFQLAKVKLTQCYYRVVNLQSGSMQWSPYQSQVYGYNAGNIWNMLQGWE